MNADNPYFTTEITDIPIVHLKDTLQKEIAKLMFDFGQKFIETDQEYVYLINQTAYALRNYYPKWRLNYLDECFRKGKLDEYDKGQKVTMKRLEYWLKSYNISLMDRIKVKTSEKVYSTDDNDRFAANAKIYGPAMRFRQMRKPEFDAEEWTLKKISALPSFLSWMNRGAVSPQTTESLIFKKIY